jgi:ABC-type multidrug transport system ATPase subunit
MLVGQTRVLALDEISTGLDSATLYSIITYLKQAVAGFETTMVISLLQPPPEVLHLFDDLLLLSEG